MTPGCSVGDANCVTTEPLCHDNAAKPNPDLDFLPTAANRTRAGHAETFPAVTARTGLSLHQKQTFLCIYTQVSAKLQHASLTRLLTGHASMLVQSYATITLAVSRIVVNTLCTATVSTGPPCTGTMHISRQNSQTRVRNFTVYAVFPYTRLPFHPWSTRFVCRELGSSTELACRARV